MADSLKPVAAALQPAVAALEKHATQPNAAYTLSGLCIAASPFGFGHKALGADKAPRVLPPFWQLLGFGFFFGVGGYMIAEGDPLNGSGVVTAVSVGVATLGLGVHGSYYFDKASWRGAVPGLLPPPRTE